MALQKHESKLQRTGEQLSLELALTDRKIIHDDIERLKQVLRLVMVKVGLRADNWPEGEEKKILIAHILENYGGHTVAEIRLAFEMAITGQLEDGDGKVLSSTCYENFSCQFFSSVMNSYRRWARQVVETLSAKEEQTEQDRVNINMLYACYLQNKINKLPCKRYSSLRLTKRSSTMD